MGFKRQRFVKSVVSIFKVEGYDHNQFLDRLQSNPGALTHATRVNDYKLQIEDIYNYRSRNPLMLRYAK